MSIKVGLLFFALVAGCIALPLENERDMSIFFEHVDPSARIVGGQSAGSAPFMMALTSGTFITSLLCGASLLTPTRGLTAAHCIVSLPSSLRGQLGTKNFGSGGTTVSFTGRVNHPNYNANQIKNDVGILFISGSVSLSSSISLVSLNWNFVGGGAPTTAYGWGRTFANGPVSQSLLQISGSVVDGNTCVTQVAQRAQQVGIIAPAVNPNLEICTFTSSSTGMCNGDSGSPLINAGKQIGIVSWGLPCARNAPDMFVRVSAYRSFIEQNS